MGKIINVIAVIGILSVSVIASFIPSPVHADTWYDTDWLYRRLITVNHAYIDATLTNFTVFVDLHDGVNFDASKAQADGDDIRFVSTDGATVYNYEREYHTNAGGGHSYYWVKIPSVSDSTDTTFYVYYGNAAAADGENATSAWDSSYKTVLHMSDYTGTTSWVGDSTVNAAHQQKHAANEPIETASGKMYEAQDFTTAGWFIGGSYDVGSAFTIEMWVRPVAGYDANPSLWSGVHTGTYGNVVFDQNLFWYSDGTDKVGWASETGNSYVFSTSTLADNTWGYVACSSYNKNNKVYVNDDAASSYTAANNPAAGVATHYIGTRGDVQQYFKGQMDEFRWSNVQRSDAWIHANYYSTANLLLSYGAEDTGTSCTVTTVAASNVLSSVARLNGRLDDQGDAECTVMFGWDTVSHAADFSAYTSNTTLAGTWATGESFYYDLSSLAPSTTYYFNTYAYNGLNTDYGTELSFTTSAEATGSSVGAPTYFTGTPSSSAISLTWVRGSSTNTTLIRYAAGNSAPTSNTTGTLLYDGGLTYTSLTGLSRGTTYSFIAWGISPEGAWSTTNATITITTLGTADTSDVSPSVSTPDNFFTDTDYTNMSSTLFYDIINDTIDNFGWDRNMGWAFLSIMLAIIAAIIVSSTTHQMVLGIAVVEIGMIIGWLQQLVPLWIPLASLIFIFVIIGHNFRNQGG